MRNLVVSVFLLLLFGRRTARRATPRCGSILAAVAWPAGYGCGTAWHPSPGMERDQEYPMESGDPGQGFGDTHRLGRQGLCGDSCPQRRGSRAPSE